MHGTYGSSAPLAYGGIYELPADVGTFDAAVFGAILMHVRDPFAALSAVADRVLDPVVVTGSHWEPEGDPNGNVVRFAPHRIDAPNRRWMITPGAVVRMLERLGFSDPPISFHAHPHHLVHDMTKPPVDIQMYAVAAHRS